MSAKKVAAGGILAAGLPLLIDAAAEPYSHRGVMESWARGAVALSVGVAFRWACQQFVTEVSPDGKGR